VEGDVSQLVRNDPRAAESLALRFRPFEHFHHRALRILERDHVADRRLRILLPRGAQPVRRGLLFEAVEIVVGTKLESDSRAFRLFAPAQDHRMMVIGICHIDRVALLRNEGQPEDVRVILRLLVEIGGLIAGVRYLSHSDHGDGSH
jgi:hypothetical protein